MAKQLNEFATGSKARSPEILEAWKQGRPIIQEPTSSGKLDLRLPKTEEEKVSADQYALEGQLKAEDWVEIVNTDEWKNLDRLEFDAEDPQQRRDAARMKNHMKRTFWSDVIQKDETFSGASEEEKDYLYGDFFNLNMNDVTKLHTLRTGESPLELKNLPREFSKGVIAAFHQVPETVMGIGYMVADLRGEKESAQWWKTGQEYLSSKKEKQRMGMLPSNNNAWERWSLMIGQGAGSAATAYGLAPLGSAVPAALFGVHAGSDQYSRGRENGLTPWQSFSVALPAGVTEAVLEKVGIDMVFKGVGGFARRAIRGMVTEAAQEFSQEISQNLYSMIYDPETRSFKGAFQGAFEAAIIGAMLGGPAGLHVDLSINRSARHIVSKNLGMDLNSEEGKRWVKIVRETLHSETDNMKKLLKEEQERQGVTGDEQIDQAAALEEITPEKQALAEALWTMIDDDRLTPAQQKRLVQEPLTEELLGSIRQDWQDDLYTMIGKLAEDLESAKGPDIDAALSELQNRQVGLIRGHGKPGRTQRPTIPGDEVVPRNAQTMTELSARTGIPANEIAKLRKDDQVRALNDPEFAQDLSVQWLNQGRIQPEKPFVSPVTIDINEAQGKPPVPTTEEARKRAIERFEALRGYGQTLQRAADRGYIDETGPGSPITGQQGPKSMYPKPELPGGASRPPQDTPPPTAPVAPAPAPAPKAPPAAAAEEAKKVPSKTAESAKKPPQPTATEEAPVVEEPKKATATIPGTSIEFDSVSEQLVGNQNLVTFSLKGKRVHEVKARNAKESGQTKADYDSLLTKDTEKAPATLQDVQKAFDDTVRNVNRLHTVIGKEGETPARQKELDAALARSEELLKEYKRMIKRADEEKPKKKKAPKKPPKPVAPVEEAIKDALTTDKELAPPGLFEEEEEEGGEVKMTAKAPSGTASGASAIGAGYGNVGYSESEGPKRAGSSKRVEAKRPQPPHPNAVAAALDTVVKVAAPSARSPMSREAALVVRGELGMLAQKKKSSYAILEEAVRYFTFKSREEVLEFIDRMENGKPQETAAEDQIAFKLREILDNRRGEVQDLGKGFLQQFYENYFPHMWKDPAAASTLIGKILGKRPLSGPKSFLKKRTILTFKEGIEAGLEPVTDNPVEMVLLKVYEMDRLIMAHTVIRELKEKNLIQFVHARRKAPEGFVQLKDYAFQVFMPPEMTVQESYDQVLVDSLMTFAESIGIDHKRLMRLHGKALGYAQRPKTVRTKFASPESVMAHEIGHILGFEYDLFGVLRWEGKGAYREVMKGKNAGQKRFVPTRDAIDHRKVIDEEWRALADARWEGEVKESFKKYVRKEAEKEAVLIEALIHAPKKMQELAPTLTAEFKSFINRHAELRPLLDIQPSLVLGTGTGKIKVPGVTKLGEYYAPEHVATLINNHLAPGLQKNALYNAARYMGNILNQVQLGFSAFHGINTGLDAVSGQIGLGLRKVLAIEGQRSSGFMDIITAPAAPFVNLWKGGQFIKDYSKSIDQIQDPELRALVERFARAGGRTGLDPFYYNQGADNIRKDIESVVRRVGAEKVSAAFRLPLDVVSAVVEVASAPLMKYWVPRQKIGAWLKMAESEMKRAQTEGFKTGITQEQLGEMLSRAWDSVDNRMGQLVYDNIFWNKTMKDGLMLAIRSVGWNIGSWREYAGSVTDVFRTKQRIDAGDVWLSNKMGYVVGTIFNYSVIGAVLTYLLTGRGPEELKDYFFPPTGDKNTDGSDERLSLPTYARDFWAYSTRSVETVGNKLHPMIATLSDFWYNEDFYGTEIVGKDDPLMKKLLQVVEHVSKQFVPISVRSYQRLRRTTGHVSAKDIVSAASGITPAGRYITRSPAQMLMYKHIMDQRKEGSRIRTEGERSEAKNQILDDLRNDRDIDRDNMIYMSHTEWRDLVKRSKQDPLVGSFKRLTFKAALDVYLVASPEERAKLKRPLREKAGNADRHAWWFPEARELYREILKQER